MQTTRIELEGAAGHVAIERRSGDAVIRIDSMVRNPRGEQAWMTWTIPARSGDDELLKIAALIQQRSDGVRGTNSDIHDYFRELQRFQA